jgi:putative membrane protein
MSPALKKFCQRWFVNTVAVLVAANVVPGISYDTVSGLLVASLLLGILNSFLRPIILLLSLPLLILTLGLFTLVINALLLYLVAYLVGPFHVNGFGSAFWGALVISIVSLLVNSLIGTEKPAKPAASPPGPPPRKGDSGGPIIDV